MNRDLPSHPQDDEKGIEHFRTQSEITEEKEEEEEEMRLGLNY